MPVKNGTNNGYGSNGNNAAPKQQKDPSQIFFFGTARGDIITHSEGLSAEQFKAFYKDVTEKLGVGSSFKLLKSNYLTANGNPKYTFQIQSPRAEDEKNFKATRGNGKAAPAQDDI